MEQETLFTSSKWDILQSLGSGEKSPIELAKSSKTSVANISQQLRLLELAGFVSSRRISNRDKDKPRILYNLKGNNSFFIISSPGFVSKKFFNLTPRQKAIARIWFLEEQALCNMIEKAFWQLEPQLKNITQLLFDTDKPTLYIVTPPAHQALLKKQYSSITVDDEGTERTIKCVILGQDEIPKKNLYMIYEMEGKK
ncbi:MAG: helix-turn-helix domain-containing protein [archaeon]